MKRLLVLAVLSLTGVFLVTSVAISAGPTKSSMTSKATPKRDKKKPYKVKTTGKVSFPTTFCAPNAPNANCVPLICPAGVRDARYCSRPALAAICSGKVKISYKRGTKTSSKTVNLKSNCTYTKSVTLTKRGRYKITVRFAGNAILAASKASTKNFRAG